MTERFSTLLHDEAQDLAIPSAPTDAILTAGRRRVRRRRAGLVPIVAVAVLAGGALVHVAGGGPHTPVALDPATAPAATDWAVAQGSAVHLGTGATVKVPGAVKAMYYSSAGTLVRVGASPYTDAPDSNYWLAGSDGTLTDFKLSLGDRVPGTDPTLPYLAYAEQGDDDKHWQLVIRDIRDGSTVREIPFTGRFTWGGWEAPPVSLSGDHVYVGVDGTLLDIAWRDGTVSRTTIPTHMPATRGTRDVVPDRLLTTVLDIPSGRTIFEAPNERRALRLSPDGSHVAVLPYAMCNDDGACSYEGKPIKIVDLATGAARTTSLEYGAFGWSATGRLLRVDGTSVQSCDPDTMACTTTKVTLDGTGPIRVSGNSNES